MGELKKVDIEIYCSWCKGAKVIHSGESVGDPCPYCKGEGATIIGYIKLPKSLFDT